MNFINIKKTLTLFQLLFIIFIGNASNVNFYNINEKYGISMRETNTICKDDVGFVWASSKTGIIRVTEDDCRLYHLPYNKANVISVQLVYDNNCLLAYTNNGQIFKYNQVFDQFEMMIDMGKELNSNFLSLTCVLIESPTKLWISTSNGLYKYSGELSFIDIHNGLVHRLERINDSQLIYGTYSGFSILEMNTLEAHEIYKNDLNENFEPSNMYYDFKTKLLWFGTLSRGLFRLNVEDGSFEHLYKNILPKQPILAIEENTDSTFLIGIDGQGIWEIEKQGDQVLNIYKENIDNPYSLRGNGVYDIYCDENKRVWVSTYSGGVSYFDQKSPIVTQITHLPNNKNSIANNDVNCVIQDVNDRIWFATNNGISRWDMSKNEWRNFYVNKQEQAQVFLTLCEDDLGRIWAGTYSSGVYVLDESNGKQLAHYSKQESNSPFITDFVFDISKDSLGHIWIGGINSQVVRYDANKDDYRKYTVQPLNVLTEFTQKQMLFGCTYGLCLSDNNTGEIQILLDGCLVHDILVQDSIIWIGTSGDGLIRYNSIDRTSETYTVDSGLPSNFVNSVAFSNGFLWLGTESGICRFDPDLKSALVYSTMPLLSSNSFNRNAHNVLSNGNLIWGSNNGAIIFNPLTIAQDHSKGKIYLQDINISGRSIRIHSDFNLVKPIDQFDQLVLKYNQNTISIELLAIGVASGSKFSWKLEGLDEEWTPPASNRVLSYSNVPSKEYQLKIRLYDNSLSHIIDERTLFVKITPPFWGTWYFLVILIVIITGIIYLTLWYYINMLKQKHTEEKIRFFTNTAHDIRTSLTLIKAPIEELSKEENHTSTGRYFLNIAKEQANRLSSVVTQLMDFQKVDIGKGQLSFRMVDVVQLISNRTSMFESLANNKKIKIQFNSNQNSFITAIDETMIEKVVDNLISNAIKYSYENTEVQINLDRNESKWSIEVIDKGIGISKKAQRQLFKEFYRGENAINSKIVGSGIGLLLVKNYVTLHGGTVSCNSSENLGSCFQVTIPVKTISSENSVFESISDKLPVLNTSEEASIELKTKEIKSGKMRILVVEDNDDLRNFIYYALGNSFEVISAENGKIALEIIQKDEPDLVVSDVMMPQMDGFELCRILKSTYETSHIPFILLTSLTGKAEQMHGLGLGADDYLTKPFDITLLQQKIKSIIINREAVREKAFKLIKSSTNEPILSNELNDQFVKKLLEIVKENIGNTEFNKNVFAAAMNVSSSLLYKKIKALTNQSPTDFIKTVRLNYSLELLQLKKYNVTEISELCGFSSVGYFSTVFKKHYGKSPTDV